MKSFPQLETKRLHLVHIGHQYKRDYFEIMSMDKVTAYYGMESLEKVEQAATIINSFHDLYAQKRAIRWGIILKETNKFIGTIGLHHLYEASKKAEIGFELHPDHWRKGIATEAINEVLNYSFKKMELFRIGAITFPENKSSNQLLKKIGFQQEGQLRGYLYQHNESHNANIYSLLKPEWERANKKEYEMDERLMYRDHMSEIVKEAEGKGDFEHLPGKGKPLKFEQSYFNPPEKQLNKTLKDNHILPRWVELSHEIDKLKKEIKLADGKQKQKKLKEANKKIKEYNYACPPSLQKNILTE